MKLRRRFIPAAMILASMAGCGTDKTETRVEVVQRCGPSAPNGACDAGQTCFEGACVVSATLCSPTNTAGTCSAGSTCFAGGCVLDTAFCSADNHRGLCASGQACVDGDCVTEADLCSTGNATGVCEAGATCLEGFCLPDPMLCGDLAPDGLCPVGSICFEDACTVVATLCSSSNPTGRCLAGQTCYNGLCAPTQLDACAVDRYTVQPTLGVRTAITAAATATLTLNAVVAGNTVTVDSVVFTAVASGATGEQFNVGATDVDTAANIAALINANATTTALVTATAATNVVTVTAKAPGVRGNGIAFTGTAGRFSASAQATTAGGHGTGKGTLSDKGFQFRDASGNGLLDYYEDWRKPEACRAKDLLSKMTVDQKVGLLTSATLPNASASDPVSVISASNVAKFRDAFFRQGISRVRGAVPAQYWARLSNNMQEIAEAEALGVPVLQVQDPRNTASEETLTPWPGTLGIGAINDLAVTKQWAENVNAEYRAVGQRMQYGPMYDICTEPRWRRCSGTLGENALAVAWHARVITEAFQGAVGKAYNDSNNLHNGVASCVKHFLAHGAQLDGIDAHGYDGRWFVFPGNNFHYHWIGYQSAFDAGAAATMPAYGILYNLYEPQWDPDLVPQFFNKPVITGLLKEQMGFDGLVTADWGTAGGRSFNMEALTPAQKAAKALAAGSHQYGSDSPAGFKDALTQGLTTEAMLDGAAGKVLELYFKLGLFENPYVDDSDTGPAATDVRSPARRQAGFDAMKKAVVILRNGHHSGGNARFLPLSGASSRDTNGDGVVRIFYDGTVKALNGADYMSDVLEDYDYRAAADVGAGLLEVAETTDLAVADIWVYRMSSSITGYDGSTNTRNSIIDALRVRDGYTKFDGTVVPAANPTLKIVLVISFSAPPIMPGFLNGLVSLDEPSAPTGAETTTYPLVDDPANIRTTAGGGVDAVLLEFGIVDRGVLDVLFNVNVPAGYAYGRARVPIEIPSSLAAVEAQLEDVPSDSQDPAFAIWSGSTY